MNRDKLKEYHSKLLEYLLSYTYIKFDQGIETIRKINRYRKQMRYMQHKKRTEAFLERGRLYQFLRELPIYSKLDLEMINTCLGRGWEIPYKTTNVSKADDVFMVVNIVRFSFDCTILEVLIEDRIGVLVIKDDAAIFPWTVFKDVI